MWTWLVGVVVVVLIWGRLWQTQPKTAFGVLLGLPLAWILSLLLRPYLTGMEAIPVWLPALPLAIIALTMLISGAWIWLRADRFPQAQPADEHSDHAEHGHH
jgi:hypothetical protein